MSTNTTTTTVEKTEDVPRHVARAAKRINDALEHRSPRYAWESTWRHHIPTAVGLRAALEVVRKYLEKEPPISPDRQTYLEGARRRAWYYLDHVGERASSWATCALADTLGLTEYVPAEHVELYAEHGDDENWLPNRDTLGAYALDAARAAAPDATLYRRLYDLGYEFTHAVHDGRYEEAGAVLGKITKAVDAHPGFKDNASQRYASVVQDKQIEEHAAICDGCEKCDADYQ